MRTNFRNRAAQLVQELLTRAGYRLSRDPARLAAIELKRRGVTTIVDIGANVGQFARRMRTLGYDGRILSVEPLAVPFQALVTASSKDPRWQVAQLAVGREPGTSTMHVSKASASSSFLMPTATCVAAAPTSRATAQEAVAVTTIDALFLENQIAPEQAFVKLDIQGYERAALEGATATVASLVGIQIELSNIELYDGQDLAWNMIRWLTDRNFDLWYVEPGFKDPASGRLLQMDGTFFRQQ